MADVKPTELSLNDFMYLTQVCQRLVAQDIITQKQMDTTLDGIAKEFNVFADRNKRAAEWEKEFLAGCIQIDAATHPATQNSSSNVANEQTVQYMSLTEYVRSHHMENPGYVIQSWLRSDNTLDFLDMWERDNNPVYDPNAYASLREMKKSSAFTVTPKQWIERTKAIGLVSKQGKAGGTFAHPLIACEFATWISPRFKMLMLQMSQFRDEFFGRSGSK